MRAKRIGVVCLGAFAVLSPVALAQTGTGWFRWEGSVDGGEIWVGDELLVRDPWTTVQLRARVGWSLEGSWGFAGTTLDIVVETPDQTADDLVNPARPWPLYGPMQTLVTTRFGNVLKLDDSRDTMPPGKGNRGIVIGQATPVWFEFDPGNPITIFTLSLVLDGTSGPRLVTEAFQNLSSEMNNTDRVFKVYTTPGGGTTVPLTTRHPLTIRVLCPSDFTQDGQVDFFDYLDFVHAYGVEHEDADVNYDGQIDFNDYLDFVAAFSAGC